MIASMAGTDPPGELIHRLMSECGSSAYSRKTWAHSWVRKSRWRTSARASTAPASATIAPTSMMSSSAEVNTTAIECCTWPRMSSGVFAITSCAPPPAMASAISPERAASGVCASCLSPSELITLWKIAPSAAIPVAMQQADGEHRTAAQPVRECAGRQQQAGERQRVSVDHPLQVGEARIQVGRDRRQRDIHDRDVHEQHEDRQTGHKQGPPLTRHRSSDQRPDPWIRPGQDARTGRSWTADLPSADTTSLYAHGTWCDLSSRSRPGESTDEHHYRQPPHPPSGRRRASRRTQ